MEKERNCNVSHGEMQTLPRIIAVDADGTLWKDEFPVIGEIIIANWNRVLEEQARGTKIILWTCRCAANGTLKEAVDFCGSHGLYFDAVNENVAEVKNMFNTDTRKVYADEYWDDKANPAFIDWRHNYETAKEINS